MAQLMAGIPLGCAVASAVLDEVAAPRVFGRGEPQSSGALRQGLEGLAAQYPDVFEGVTGAGLMLGLKCKASNIDVVTAGYDCEVLTVPAADNVVRVLPALNISNTEIAQALERLETAAQAVQSAQ